jgi:hypothetical protein
VTAAIRRKLIEVALPLEASMLAKPEVAAPLIDEPPPPPPPPPGGDGGLTRVGVKDGPKRPHHFSASATLRDPTRPVPELTSIAQHVIAHLAASPDVKLRVELVISADHDGDGFDDTTQRNVSENAGTLRLRFDWEER